MLEVIIQVRAGWRAADDYDCEDNDDEVYDPMIMIPQVRLAERREAIAMMLMMVFMK